jgi:hypothetical protein
MLFAKVVTVLVAGVLTAITMRRVISAVNAAKARVHAKTPQQPNTVTRLRQDPATGIYYPIE